MGCLRRLLNLALVAVLLVVASVLALSYLRTHEHCTVGLQGATVSITVDGPGAEVQCNSFQGQVTDGGSWYRYTADAQPGGAAVCQLGYAGDTFTVRDEGTLTLYGQSACRYISGLASQGGG